MRYWNCGQARPFGVSLLIAGVDEKGPALYVTLSILLLSQVLPCSIPATTCVYGRYHTDPSGTYSQYEAKAIGAGSEGANTALQEHYNKVPTGCFCNCIRSIV